MRYRGWHAGLVLLCLALGCGEDTARWEAAQKASAEKPKAVAESALPGSTFNRFFPKQVEGYELIFKQEKTGFAQASLNRDGNPIAMLSIFDTRSNPGAKEKYKDTADTIAGHPAVVRENTTSILVADRFQVQVQSEGDALTEEDRARWFEKFDLDGLAKAL